MFPLFPYYRMADKEVYADARYIPKRSQKLKNKKLRNKKKKRR